MPYARCALPNSLNSRYLQHEFLVILDETVCQNTPNTSRVLYESGTKNTMPRISHKIKINMIECQSINWKSYVEATIKSNAYTF